MKTKIFFFIPLFYLLISCQKELSFPADSPVVSEKVISAIVITNAAQNEFDSIVYRYLPDKTREVHYRQFGDSVSRTYYYDGANRLAKIEDEKALYYTNNNIAQSISFQYNSNGELIKTLTDFKTVTGVPAYYNNSASDNVKKIIGYDSSYITSSYNLDWANRIIYNTLSEDNYLVYDSCISFNNSTGGTTTLVSDFSYDANNNVTGIRKYTYQDGELAEWGVVTVKTDRPAPIYEGLRKKLFRNLSNWYEASSVSQDDSYRFFTIPGHMNKKLSYSGFSLYGAADPLTVSKGFDYENEYNNDLLLKSIVTIWVTGQGNIHYVNDIRYYYK